MYARRRVHVLEECRLPSLRERVPRLPVTEDVVAVILKDIHLIEAATATDRTVCSTDDRMRGHLTRACDALAECREMIWVNADREEETPIPWVLDGAKLDRQRQLRRLAGLR